MRLWSIHPGYLDQKGLVALWRETLLAQKVLLGETKGYKNHPQLQRFKEQEDPIQTIATYLHHVADEADRRGYNFNREKIVKDKDSTLKLEVTQGQFEYELNHLLKKLKTRCSESYEILYYCTRFDPIEYEVFNTFVHPLFKLVNGDIADWEKV